MSKPQQDENKGSLGPALLTFGGVGFVCVVVAFSVYILLPDVAPEQKAIVTKLPRDLNDVRALHTAISQYSDEHSSHIALLIAVIYISLQAVSIPGPILLNVLYGALFGVPIGCALSLFCATVGSAAAYLLSYSVTHVVFKRTLKARLEDFRAMVAQHSDNMISYMLFLRLTPFLPNWFINVASPIVGIPLPLFVGATFFGLIPGVIVSVRAGLTLTELHGITDILDPQTIILIGLLGVLVLVPTFPPVKRLMERYLGKRDKKCD